MAGLFHEGIDKILKKIGEEASETIIAGKSGDKRQIVYETADLWFHSIMLLKFRDIEIDEVFKELDGRFGISGLEEKAIGRVSSRGHNFGRRLVTDWR